MDRMRGGLPEQAFERRRQRMAGEWTLSKQVEISARQRRRENTLERISYSHR